MDFEAYLISKHIDSQRFSSAEPEVWQSWKNDFDQMHPNSFTVQKLNMINPIRRKYQMAMADVPKAPVSPAPKAAVPTVERPVATKPAVARPGVKMPRPAMVPKPPSSSPEQVTSGTHSQEPDAPLKDDVKAAEGIASNTVVIAGETSAALAPEVTNDQRANGDIVPRADSSVDMLSAETKQETGNEITSDGLTAKDSLEQQTAPDSVPAKPGSDISAAKPAPETPTPKPSRPVMARPVIKPKPKTN